MLLDSITLSKYAPLSVIRHAGMEIYSVSLWIIACLRCTFVCYSFLLRFYHTHCLIIDDALDGMKTAHV